MQTKSKMYTRPIFTILAIVGLCTFSISGSTISPVITYLLSSEKRTKTVKIMPLGDSITWDWYYDDPRLDAQRSGYRSHLWYKLNATGYKADFVGSRSNGGAVVPRYDGDNEGYTGWTSYQISDHIYHWLELNPPDIVLLHIGTNDSVYYAPYTEGVERILTQIDLFEREKKHKIKVIVARIISLPSNSSWISQFNDNLDAMVRRRVANGDNIAIVDMEYGAGLDYSRDLIDGIHPTNCGYEKMANVWFTAITGKAAPRLASCYR
jgi:lysophospholipase L1-like esterase